jgi:hypothetical protein
VLLPLTRTLKVAKFSGFYIPTSNEPRLLHVKIPDLFFKRQIGFELDESGTNGLVLIFEHALKLDLSASIDRELKARDAGETPEDIGQGLHQLLFLLANGLPFFLEGLQMIAVFGGVVGWEQDRFAG